MCIMEIHAHAQTATMVQAMTHNLSTVDRDADMVMPILTARGEHQAARSVARAQHLVHEAYAILLAEFGIEVAQAAMDHEGHVPPVGGERSLVSVINAATRAARKDETR